MSKFAVKDKVLDKGQTVTPEIYRLLLKPGDLVRARVVVKETNLIISASRDLGEEAERLVIQCRRDIEEYIEEYPHFERSLIPVKFDISAPPIVKTMIAAAARIGVGPMASVAGAIAEYVGRGLLRYSSEVIVENGGDIFCRSHKERVVLLLAETSDFVSVRIALPPSDNPVGLCTSSGTSGHSLSFGNADSVTVLCASTALADAAATAIGNVIKRRSDMKKGVKVAQKMGVNGIVVIAKGHIVSWGEIRFI